MALARDKVITPLVDDWLFHDIPVDLSFMDFEAVEDIPKEMENTRPYAGNTATLVGDKYQSACLRLNNNKFQNLDKFMPTVAQIILQPEALRWIDLSFNKLKTIDPVLCQFRRLHILYLHGNDIQELKEVDKLGRLKDLFKLCLHGNPIAQNPVKYRCHILSHIKSLVDLDMSTTSEFDHINAHIYAEAIKQKKRKKRE